MKRLRLLVVAAITLCTAAVALAIVSRIHLRVYATGYLAYFSERGLFRVQAGREMQLARLHAGAGPCLRYLPTAPEPSLERAVEQLFERGVGRVPAFMMSDRFDALAAAHEAPLHRHPKEEEVLDDNVARLDLIERLYVGLHRSALLELWTERLGTVGGWARVMDLQYAGAGESLAEVWRSNPTALTLPSRERRSAFHRLLDARRTAARTLP